jgi:hypothetical protein
MYVCQKKKLRAEIYKTKKESKRVKIEEGILERG